MAAEAQEVGPAPWALSGSLAAQPAGAAVSLGGCVLSEQPPVVEAGAPAKGLEARSSLARPVAWEGLTSGSSLTSFVGWLRAGVEGGRRLSENGYGGGKASTQ